MPARISVDCVSVASDIPSTRSIRRWVRAALAADADAELCVRIVDEDEMKALNSRYRGQDYAANVLSFPAAVPPEQLYTEGPLVHEFPRTVSRLNEMQSKEYLSLERRVVDTGLT